MESSVLDSLSHLDTRLSDDPKLISVRYRENFNKTREDAMARIEGFISALLHGEYMQATAALAVIANDTSAIRAVVTCLNQLESADAAFRALTGYAILIDTKEVMCLPTIPTIVFQAVCAFGSPYHVHMMLKPGAVFSDGRPIISPTNTDTIELGEVAAQEARNIETLEALYMYK